ncbi:MAG: serine/threonine-protein kinase [Rhodothermales bacterium]|nr:serine/threonine-protein kinase [Rhodothermales bacterium]MBO6778076.1 serine/threonine-protein kinase [Rhodothermales bacterium]
MVGSHLAHYRVESLLGQGGMGIVYRAYDTRLRRVVALKVMLPGIFGKGQDRSRFFREARAAAGLRHPAIATVYEIGEAVPSHDSTTPALPFIAMEFAEGRTLKERLRDGPLPERLALKILQDVAAGLGVAHAHGIVHRDIKPSNLIVGGPVTKILDFGLAKSAEYTDLTLAGSTLGTVAYMSPEQAQGVPVDGRTDLWSLGVVLHEMLTGKRPFDADFPQAVIYRILHDPVPPLPGGVSASTRTIHRELLTKEAEDRLQRGEDVLSRLGSEDLSRIRSRRWRIASFRKARSLLPAVTVLAGLTLLMAIALSGESDPVPESARQLTYDGRSRNGAISPDGTQFAAYRADSDSTGILTLTDIGSSESRTLVSGITKPMLVDAPIRWSPDGTQLAFYAEIHGLRANWVVSRAGGPPRQMPVRGHLAAWSPDGGRIAIAARGSREVQLVDLSNLDTTPIALAAGHAFLNGLNWSPDGSRLALVTDRSQVWSLSLSDTSLALVHQDSTRYLENPTWARDSRSLYLFRWGAEERAIINTPVRTGRQVRARLVRTGVRLCCPFSLSDSNQLVYSSDNSEWNVHTKELGSADRRQLTTGNAHHTGSRISPDGQWVAYSKRVPSGRDVFTRPVSGGAETRRTFEAGRAQLVAWSPDGSEIAFTLSDNPAAPLRVVRLSDGAVRSEPVSDASFQGLEWLADGTLLVPRADNRTWFALREGRQKLVISDDSTGWALFARGSQDAGRVAFWRNSRDSAARGLLVVDLVQSSEKIIHVVPASERWQPVAWRGDWIYALRVAGHRETLMRIRPDGSQFEALEEIPIVTEHDFISIDLSPNATTMVFSFLELQSDVYLVGNFDPVSGVGRR